MTIYSNWNGCEYDKSAKTMIIKNVKKLSVKLFDVFY